MGKPKEHHIIHPGSRWEDIEEVGVVFEEDPPKELEA
jgi:hypothetical protein